MPLSRREEAFFGVAVGRDFYSGEGRHLLRRYRLWLVAALVAIEAASLVVSIRPDGLPSMVFTRMASSLVLTVAAFFLYAMFSRRVQPFEVREEKRAVASLLKRRAMIDYTNIALEVMVAILVIAPIALLIYYYPQLPDRIPAHLDSRGEMVWETKSFTSVFSLSVLNVYLQGLFLISKYALVKAAMTLPAEHAEEYLDCKEASLRLTVKFLDHFRFGIVALLGLVSAEIFFRSVERVQTIIISGIALSIVAGIAGLWLLNRYVNRWSATDRRLKELTGKTYVRRNGARWAIARLVYYNREDAAAFVETPVGPGVTFNLARIEARACLAYWAALPLLVLWILKIL
jgi:uncharacterized membrane protein